VLVAAARGSALQNAPASSAQASPRAQNDFQASRRHRRASMSSHEMKAPEALQKMPYIAAKSCDSRFHHLALWGRPWEQARRGRLARRGWSRHRQHLGSTPARSRGPAVPSRGRAEPDMHADFTGPRLGTGTHQTGRQPVRRLAGVGLQSQEHPGAPSSA